MALEPLEVRCPYCGEPTTVEPDPPAPGPQQLWQDCEVCCRPILFRLAFDADGSLLQLDALRDDDA